MTIAITTDHPVVPINFLVHQATLAVKEGLDRATALRAMTINPARIIGLTAGSVARAGQGRRPGDLVGDPLDVMSRAERAFMDGREIYRYDYDLRDGVFASPPGGTVRLAGTEPRVSWAHRDEARALPSVGLMASATPFRASWTPCTRWRAVDEPQRMGAASPGLDQGRAGLLDPELATLLTTFTRLAADEEMPAGRPCERVAPGEVAPGEVAPGEVTPGHPAFAPPGVRRPGAGGPGVPSPALAVRRAGVAPGDHGHDRRRAGPEPR